ncbi:MAG: CDP-alcohol phosphatidyltransferase family protein [Tannerella sp.]|jgi:CDP-diacylglycerol--serine O-phosphatidyltransferase|nr:CDP-alcohol phosphatidyltransferase family protein [Tannerella sp.]
MNVIVRHIPNALTCASLSFGFYASVAGISGDYANAMIAILIAAVLDFSDGLAARVLKASSPMGKELDSLSDVVSFGVAPGMMLFSFLDGLSDSLSWSPSWTGRLFLLPAFAIPVFSALRLAKFNLDTRQKTSFIGLPVPAHAILWSSVITAFSPAVIPHKDGCTGLCFAKFFTDVTPEILLAGLSVFAIITSLLLVSGIPMFSLKMSSFSWKENKLQYILLLSAVVFVAFAGMIGVSATILLYILLSVVACRNHTGQ